MCLARSGTATNLELFRNRSIPRDCGNAEVGINLNSVGLLAAASKLDVVILFQSERLLAMLYWPDCCEGKTQIHYLSLCHFKLTELQLKDLSARKHGLRISMSYVDKYVWAVSK